MGQYSLPPNLASGARRTIARPGSQARPQPAFRGILSLSGLAFWSRAIRGHLRVGCSDARPEHLRLFQLLPPLLAGRAKTFGKVLRTEMACTDTPYFDAPGALVAPLGPEAFLPQDMPEVRACCACCACWAACHTCQLKRSLSPRPQVTTVFCSIDGARRLRWRRAEARQEVHQLCSRAIKETLRAMPEGYLSGEQPGDLKYMVAFASPEVGRSWLRLRPCCSLFKHAIACCNVSKSLAELYGVHNALYVGRPRRWRSGGAC
jgi:hypothetical protein